MLTFALAVGFLGAAAPAQQGAPDPKDPNVLFQRALTEQRAGQFEAAVRDYRALLVVHPEAGELRINLGASLVGLGRFDEAIAEYKKALAASPENDGIRLNLALAFYKKGSFAEAVAPLQDLHRRHPEDERTAVLLGDSLRQSGRPERAVPLLQPFAARNPADADLAFIYGSALTQAGRKQSGLDELERAGKLGRTADPWLLAGATALELDALDRAKQDLDRALAVNPNLPGVQALAAQAHEKTGDTEGAKDLFRRAVQRDPQDFQSNLHLGAILYKERKLDEARPYLQRALERDPKSALARYQMGLLLVAEGSVEAGITQLEQVAQQDPKWLEPHVQLAALYYKSHRPQDGARERALVDRLRTDQQGRN